MPIEFPCSQCGKTLRTADETAGRQARCPACGAVMQVPGGVAGGQPGREAAADGESPFGSGATAAWAEDSVNPYQAPADVGSSSPFRPAVPPIDRVRTPAICLIVMSSLWLVVFTGITALYSLILVMSFAEPRFAGPRGEAVGIISMMIGVGVVGVVMSVVALMGAVRMKNLRSYGLAMTSAIIMLIPCIWPCWFLSMPFGIWALVVLANGEVRAAFR